MYACAITSIERGDDNCSCTQQLIAYATKDKCSSSHAPTVCTEPTRHFSWEVPLRSYEKSLTRFPTTQCTEFHARSSQLIRPSVLERWLSFLIIMWCYQPCIKSQVSLSNQRHRQVPAPKAVQSPEIQPPHPPAQLRNIYSPLPHPSPAFPAPPSTTPPASYSPAPSSPFPSPPPSP